MKAIKFFLLAVSIFSFAKVSMAQEMQPPPPIENKAFAMAVGEWAAEPYTMMGNQITSETDKIYMKHNGQFMVVEIDGMDAAGNNYTATIFTTVDKDGNIKGWSFDVWGGDWTMTYTGKAEGNTITLNGTNPMMSETRVITLEDNKMTHDVDFTIKMPTGDVNEKLTTVYNKK